ncbi:DUF1120 domain-containing protein [Pseudomonas edaphica]|uniref:DUF1120 domain-containing protein n=1 Tax=Pseudomonas edaphica TaxID=2006980 RepID=UPI003D0EEF08
MNTRLTTLAVSTLLLSSATAFAASSVDLTVKGLIVPSACTPSLSGGGMIDHGKVSAKDLNPNWGTAIGVHTLSMTVDCDAPIQFALHPIDNRAASGLTTDFGLGFINETQKLGHFSLTWRGMVADGVTVQPIASLDQGKTWAPEKFWEPNMFMAAASMSDDTQPLPIQNLSVDLEVLTIINAAANLDLSNEVTIDGSATVEVKYL